MSLRSITPVPSIRFILLIATITGMARSVTAGECPVPGVPRLAPGLRLLEGFGEIELVLRYRAGAEQEELEEALAAAGVSSYRSWPEIRRIRARVRTVQLGNLSRNRAIQWIEESPGVDLDRDESNGFRTAVGQDQLPPIPFLFVGKGIRVGVWETGHPDIESNSGEFLGHDDLFGRVQVMEPSSPSQHATAIAGLLAGTGRSSEAAGGIPYLWRGIAPAAEVSYHSILVSNEEAWELLKSIRPEGLHLSLQPWGEAITRDRCSVLGDYTIRSAEFDQVIAGEDPARAGEGRVPVVFSAGNYQNFLFCLGGEGGGPPGLFPGFGTINPPHTAKNILAIGAVYSNTLEMTDFSSWGPTDDGRIKPDLVAPGSELGGDGGITAPASNPPDGYSSDEGTSFAAAGTAGVLAVLMGERLERGEPPLPPAAWKALLVESAWDLIKNPLAPAEVDPEIVNSFHGPDFFYGYGLIRLPEAYRLSLNPFCLKEGVIRSGERQRFIVQSLPSPRAEKLRVTLAWDDPPGDPGAPRALVNDLDLWIEEELPGGETLRHLPWVLDPNRPDRPAVRGTDRLNNIEQVEINGPLPEDLVVVVVGADVTLGPQRFWVAVGEDFTLENEELLPIFRRGDTNSSDVVDLSDAITLLKYFFQNEKISCLAAADADEDRDLDLTDVIRILDFLFLGDAPALRMGQCVRVTPFDSQGCKSAPPCRDERP